MIPLSFSYATPSAFSSTRERAALGLVADVGRPVRFHGRLVRDVLPFRFALQALGQVVWHTDEWLGGEFTLDPIVTVHPDRVQFEAFSSDQSSYGLVIADRALFSPVGPVTCGTTNVDFTAWLWAALAELRTSRETTLRIGPEGLEVATEGAGGRFEQKVEVPEAWVRGFLQLQGAMALPGTRLRVRPVDLVAALRTLSLSKAKVSPRALRYEFEPGHDASLVLEPWETRIPLVGAAHGYSERRVVRTWGRRRLRLLEPLLPWASAVDVYLKGRALPSFYVVHLPGVRFLLGLTGWSGQRFTDSASFDLLVPPGSDSSLEARALGALRERVHASASELARDLGATAGVVTQALVAACARGQCLYDVEARGFRHRELFREPVDLARLYPPDPRRDEARAFAERGEVAIESAAVRETTKTKRLRTPDGHVTREVVHRDWVVTGRAGPESEVELVLDDEDRLIFGRCRCAFFDEHLLSRGPCAHLVALLARARAERADLPSAREAPPDAVPSAAPRGAGGDDDEDADDPLSEDEDDD
jgi:hypothetical protein